jgi:uncharacterized protein with beta-barrel porin domain
MLRTTSRRILVVVVVLVVGTFAWTMLAQANATDDQRAATIRGAGTSLVRGGTGAPSFTPVMTKFGFNWRNGQGGFECLALVPSVAAGKPGSGNFDVNAMYVTGSLTSVQVNGQSAVIKGTATVTGLGAGTNVPFTAAVTRGGPGATLVLEVSGLTFSEIVLEGEIRF